MTLSSTSTALITHGIPSNGTSSRLLGEADARINFLDSRTGIIDRINFNQEEQWRFVPGTSRP